MDAKGAEPPVPPPLPPPTVNIQQQAAYTPPNASLWEAKRLRDLLHERNRRRTEALRLYEPLPMQVNFHLSMAPERVVRGSNRSGKTLSAAVELARAVTGQDALGRYPKRDGRAFLVGKDGKHLSDVMYRKLFRAGAFWMIKDKVTGLWRAYRPWDPADLAREKESKPAPPLIPQRFVKSISWENKKSEKPEKILLVNGWELSFFSSLAKPPQGSDIDYCWLDEEIVDPAWYPEMSARLLDRKGRFVWSATPEAGTEQLWDLHERAEEESSKPSLERKIEEFESLLADNPHVSDDEKTLLESKLNEEQRAVKILGQFLILSFKVFPEFSWLTHGIDWFEIPKTWTRYVAIDPGRQVCAALFAAVAPKEEGGRVYLYDELYLNNCDAEQFAQGMVAKCNNQSIHAFIIDHMGGRVRDAGTGRTVEEYYSEALRRHKLRSVSTGYEFLWGSSDVEGTVEAVRSWLRIAPDGKPKLLCLKDKLPNFDWEIKRYRLERRAGVVKDKPESRGRVHAMACLRYLAAFDPQFIPPKEGRVGPVGPAIQAFRAKQKRDREKNGTEGVRLGPGGNKASVGKFL